MRSATLGIGTVMFINVWVTYAETVVKSSRLNLSVFQITLLAIFILLVGLINPLLKAANHRFALAPGELLAIVAIGLPALFLRFWKLGWGLDDGIVFPDEVFVWARMLMEFVPLRLQSFLSTPPHLNYPTFYGYVAGVGVSVGYSL